jgi:hypothetical protein
MFRTIKPSILNFATSPDFSTNVPRSTSIAAVEIVQANVFKRTHLLGSTWKFFAHMRQGRMRDPDVHPTRAIWPGASSLILFFVEIPVCTTLFAHCKTSLSSQNLRITNSTISFVSSSRTMRFSFARTTSLHLSTSSPGVTVRTGHLALLSS